MPSLTDLFNPTFLMFLGILVLVVALLVVYFETKFREQNHKISSMLSLVSALAEEVNGSKMIIHQLTMNHQPQNQEFFQQPNLEKRIVQNDNLILVSDDEDDSDASEAEDSDDEEDDSDASDSDSDAASEVSIDENELDELDDDDDSVIEIGESNDVKVLKLNINNDKDDGDSEDDLSEASLDNLDDLDDLEDLEDLDDSSTSSVSIKEEKNDNIKSMDLKSINITLEETKPEQPLDYKKMALPKLRSIVTEKGLSSDSSKLKKNELLKLLGVE
jgi:hypothetical protein